MFPTRVPGFGNHDVSQSPATAGAIEITWFRQKSRPSLESLETRQLLSDVTIP